MANADPDATPSDTAGPLRRGWTTGACAAAAARAAALCLVTGRFPAVVSIDLPGGQQPCFPIGHEATGAGWAEAGIVKDAGDDPDVTHGVLVIARVTAGTPGTGLVFRAGDGVGTVTRPGLALAPGEPAINPAPRQMIAAALAGVGAPPDLEVTIAIPGGARIAERTLNGRLGIVGGLSVLGTTGIVIPFSCAAWIDTIHRGIDVARACGLDHIAGATGTTSETAVQRLYGLPAPALIEMGDFAGGMLKYLARHPVARVTIAGGFAKMTKLGQGRLDLHSKRGAVDLHWLAAQARAEGASSGLLEAIVGANTAAEALIHARAAGIGLAERVAEAARRTAVAAIGDAPIDLGVAIFDRDGVLLAEAGSAVYRAR